MQKSSWAISCGNHFGVSLGNKWYQTRTVNLYVSLFQIFQPVFIVSVLLFFSFYCLIDMSCIHDHIFLDALEQLITINEKHRLSNKRQTNRSKNYHLVQPIILICPIYMFHLIYLNYPIHPCYHLMSFIRILPILYSIIGTR